MREMAYIANILLRIERSAYASVPSQVKDRSFGLNSSLV